MSEKIVHDKMTDENLIVDSTKNLFFMGSFTLHIDEDRIVFSDEFIDFFQLRAVHNNSIAHHLVSEFVNFANDLTLDEVIKIITSKGESESFEAVIHRMDGSEVWVLINGIYSEKNKEIYGRIIDVTTYKKTVERAKGSIEFLESLFELIPYPIFYQDSEGIVLRANQRMCDFMGLTEGQLLNRDMNKLILVASLKENIDLDDDSLLRNGSQVIERRLEYKDGTYHNVIFNRSVMYDEDGSVDGILGVIVDITEKTQLQERLRTHNMVKDILMSISNKVMTYDDERELLQEALEKYIKISKTTDFGSVLKIEGGFFKSVASVGYVKESIDKFVIPISKSFIFEHSGGEIIRPGIIQNVKEFDRANNIGFVDLEHASEIESVLYIPLYDGETLKYVISFDSARSFFFNEEDLITADIIKGQIELILKMFNIYNQAKIFSRYDSLTGLMNRRYFEAVFDDRMALAKRESNSLVLVHFDLDDLKGVNDHFGHLVGDDYIKLFTNLLTSHFRASDTFARIGGDEFVGLFSNSDFENLHEKMSLLRTLFQSMCVPLEDGRELCGAFSFGVSVHPFDGDTIDELMKVADERMYLFKHKNKRRIQVFNN